MSSSNPPFRRNCNDSSHRPRRLIVPIDPPDPMVRVSDGLHPPSNVYHYAVGTAESHSGISLTPDVHGVNDQFASPDFNNDGTIEQRPPPLTLVADHIPTPTDHTPSNEEIKPDFGLVRTQRKHDGNELLDHIYQKKRATLERAIPSDQLCLFLRNNRIMEMMKKITDAGNKNLNVSQTCQSAVNNWMDIREVDKLMKPFQAINSYLRNGDTALSNSSSRMWLEDYMMLEPGMKLTMLISKNHSILKGGDCKAVRLINSFEAIMRKKPLKPVQFSRTLYFAMEIYVRSNGLYRFFNDGILTNDELSAKCVKSSGAGIVFEAPVGDRDYEWTSFTIFFSNFLDHPNDIMFWRDGLTPSARLGDVRKTMYRYRDFSKVGALFSVLKDELYGDGRQTCVLCNYYMMEESRRSHELKQKNYKETTISDNRLRLSIKLKAGDKNFISFREYMDAKCRERIVNLYGKFSTLYTPILDQLLLHDLTRQFKLTLPKQYKVIIYYLAKESSKNKSLWDRYALYIFCMLMRIRNSHYFTWWAMCNAGADYGSGGSKIPVFFGLSVHHKSFMEKLNGLNKNNRITKKTVATLSKEEFLVATFDNSQIFRQRKFQRGGSSSTASIMTSRMFIKAMVPFGLDLIQFPSDLPEITYLDQKIPSPCGMPPFEDINMKDIKPSVLYGRKWRTAKSTGTHTDLSGRRVERYCKMVKISHKIYLLNRIIPFWMDDLRFEFQNEDGLVASEQLGVVATLKNIREKKADGHPAGFLQRVDEFQRNITFTWRNAGDITPAEALIPPVSGDDETTNVGAGQNIVNLLLLRGILKSKKSDEIPGDLKKIELADDYHSKFMMVVGDGLTQIRLKTFLDIIQKTTYNYSEQQDLTDILRKAMGQVICVTGDLHGGLFHFLQAVYCLFFPCLIQPVQKLLGWKRIRGSDVTKCYQQAASLATIIATELERQLFPKYLEMVHEDEGRREHFKSLGVNNDPEKYDPEKYDPEKYAMDLAIGYIDWLEDRRANSTDEVFTMILNFVHMMTLYREFRLALSNGDAVMIEWLYKEFLPLYLYTGKKHYFNIVCDMMDDLYGSVGYKLLHLVRTNRTVPLYPGVDMKGRPMANWAIDALIEQIQKYYHRMNFKIEDSEGWMQHSQHVQMNNKCIRFVQGEYIRVQSEEDDSKDRTRNRENSAAPNRKKESIIIAEFIHVNDLVTETNGRKYDQQAIYESMKNITTKLDDKNDVEIGRTWTDKVVTDAEKQLSEAVREIFENASQDATESSLVINDDDIDENQEHLSMDFETIGETIEDESSAEDGDNDAPHNGTTMSNEFLLVKVGNGKEFKIRPAALNMLAFRDVVCASKTLLESKDLKHTKHRKKLRENRERLRNQRVREAIMCEDHDSNQIHRHPHVTESLNRLRELR